jgi:hypothetical protein
MIGLADNELLRFVLGMYGLLLILGPVLLRVQFRWTCKLDPRIVPLETLPENVRSFMSPRTPQIAALGFEPVGYVAITPMVGKTSSYMALFSNPKTREWADVSVIISGATLRGYMEFITHCSDTLQVDTNNAPLAPVLFPSSGYHVFRFPQIQDAATLYRAHRRLAQEKTGAAAAKLPPAGQEMAELKRRLERYGPQQQRRGYMYFDQGESCYRLTWKGAILGGWRSIWPFSKIRNWRMEQQGASVLRELGLAR